MTAFETIVAVLLFLLNLGSCNIARTLVLITRNQNHMVSRIEASNVQIIKAVKEKS